MKKLLSINVLVLLFSMNAMADCGIYISKLDEVLSGNKLKISELKKVAEKKNRTLKLSQSDLWFGDLVINDLIYTDENGHNQISFQDTYVQTSFFYDFYGKSGVDYSKNLALFEVQNGEVVENDILRFTYKLKYSKMEQTFGGNFTSDKVRHDVEFDVIKSVIKSLPKCNQ